MPDSLLEIKTLAETGVNKLTDILYNNFYRKEPNFAFESLCFVPRNAILFLDKSGNVKEYILICFHCDRHEESSKNVNFGDDCSQKIEKLRQFFISEGLKYGTDTHINEYPGEDSGIIDSPIHK